MPSLCIVGAGITGLLLLHLLAQTQRIPLSEIVIIDPHLDGGALARQWSDVPSNTPWEKTLTAFRQYIPSVSLPSWATALPSDEPTPLAVIARLVLETVRPHLSSVSIVQGLCTEAAYSDGRWLLHTDTGKVISVASIVFTQGATPKALGLPIPSIPLEIALDTARLRRILQPNQSVLIFGTSHSGTLVIRNTLECNVTAVTAVYRGSVPFQWARDGAYDGLKMESATLADRYMLGEFPRLKLIPYHADTELLSATRTADWVIYATGFVTARTIRLTVNGEARNLSSYDGQTGRITDCPMAWGFGIGYPSQAPDGIHWDVGVASFLEHMNSQLTAILSTYQS